MNKLTIFLFSYMGTAQGFEINLEKIKGIYYVPDTEEGVVIKYKDGTTDFFCAGWDNIASINHTYGKHYEVYNESHTRLTDDFKLLLTNNINRSFSFERPYLFKDGYYMYPLSFLNVKQKRYKRKDNHTNKSLHKRFV